MIFQQILLEILHKFQGERSVSAPYYILVGKHSGQSVQDVGLFGLHSYFRILPKLQKKKYDHEINQFIQSGIIIPNNETYTLKHPSAHNSTIPFFDGWHYRGNEHIFFSRLSLIVQTLSHKNASAMNFIPIQKDEQIQSFVRQFLYKNGYQQGNLHESLYDEIRNSFHHIEENEIGKNIVVHRLTGFNTPGFTWGQLAQFENLEEMDVQLLYISFLHQWLNEMDGNPTQYPLLKQIAEGVRFIQPLSRSAYQTAVLFKKGYTIDQISMMRHIKQSTIEDHLVELAMNDKGFNIYHFISKEEVELIQNTSRTLKTKKLKVLKEAIPDASYFQLRLALSRGDS